MRRGPYVITPVLLNLRCSAYGLFLKTPPWLQLHSALQVSNPSSILVLSAASLIHRETMEMTQSTSGETCVNWVSTIITKKRQTTPETTCKFWLKDQTLSAFCADIIFLIDCYLRQDWRLCHTMLPAILTWFLFAMQAGCDAATLFSIDRRMARRIQSKSIRELKPSREQKMIINPWESPISIPCFNFLPWILSIKARIARWLMNVSSWINGSLDKRRHWIHTAEFDLQQ